MRRLGLFAGFLLLLGLTTAVAASFDVQAEDITSFSTPVSIEVPGEVRTFALRGENREVPGILDPVLSFSGSVGSTPLGPGDSHSWETPPLQAPEAPLVLVGPATLWITKNQPGIPLTVELFACPSAAAAPLTACESLSPPVTVTQIDHPGVEESEVRLGPINGRVEEDERLRLHVTNTPPSNSFRIQWGYRDNRRARLDVTLAVP